MSATITAADVKALRERTGAGMMDCKQALTEAGGDMDRAIELLRAKGQASAAKRGGREAAEGVVESYVHANNKIAVLVEVDCETDFVARTDDFKDFARDVAIHVAAMNPAYISEDDVPEDVRARELDVFAQQADPDKPEDIREKIAEGKLRKWLGEVVLLDQEHVNTDKHEGRTLEQIRADLAAKTGENVVVRRFVRYEVGGD